VAHQAQSATDLSQNALYISYLRQSLSFRAPSSPGLHRILSLTVVPLIGY
jgi:hypothetical protein